MIHEKISDYKVERRMFKEATGRWYVILDSNLFNGKKEMLQSHYNWLVSNPSFFMIPKGYIIHHLDEDKSNDDPSNLALMQKYQHTAHHFKNIINEIPVQIVYDTGLPQEDFSEPKIYERKDIKNSWIVRWWEGEKGHKKQKTLCSYKGKRISTREQAEYVKNLILGKAEPKLFTEIFKND